MTEQQDVNSTYVQIRAELRRYRREGCEVRQMKTAYEYPIEIKRAAWEMYWLTTIANFFCAKRSEVREWILN